MTKIDQNYNQAKMENLLKFHCNQTMKKTEDKKPTKSRD